MPLVLINKPSPDYLEFLNFPDFQRNEVKPFQDYLEFLDFPIFKEKI